MLSPELGRAARDGRADAALVVSRAARTPTSVGGLWARMSPGGSEGQHRSSRSVQSSASRRLPAVILIACPSRQPHLGWSRSSHCDSVTAGARVGGRGGSRTGDQQPAPDNADTGRFRHPVLLFIEFPSRILLDKPEFAYDIEAGHRDLGLRRRTSPNWAGSPIAHSGSRIAAASARSTAAA